MSEIQFVTDEKGRKVGVLIGLRNHGAVPEDFWDGFHHLPSRAAW